METDVIAANSASAEHAAKLRGARGASYPSVPAGRSLHIAFLTPVPSEDGGATGVATDVLVGLATLGHRIDCFIAGYELALPERLTSQSNLSFVWAKSRWRWDRWYSRTRLGAFLSGLLARAWAFVRLRREIVAKHERDAYDVIYQFSNIETAGVPRSLLKTVPLVIHPETHIAGELRWFRRERHLARRCEPWHRRVLVELMLITRTVIQRRSIGAATLVICISEVFRDHLVADYKVPRERTRVIPNPVRLQRFQPAEKSARQPPVLLVLGRISVRKGIDQIIDLSHELVARGIEARIRIVGAESLWSDYRPLLHGLHPANAEYVGSVAPREISDELKNCDVLVQASKYEPFGLTVAEALAAGVPVVATDEVGAAERVSRVVCAVVPADNAKRLTDAVQEMLVRLQADGGHTKEIARREARRLFACADICRDISDALQQIVSTSRTDVPPMTFAGFKAPIV